MSCSIDRCSRFVSLRLVRSLAMAVIAGTLFNHACSAADQPNFVVINVDDLGYGDIGPFGSQKNRTPHLDRMAKEGRKLTSFYAAPVCSPSRASLMTGCYPKRALPIKHVLFPGYDHGLSPQEITVAEVLKKEGYATGIVGKWHLGDQPEMLPTRQGFDSYYGLPYSNDMGPAADGVKSNYGKPQPKPRPGRRGQPPLPLMRDETVLQRVLPEDQQSLVSNYTSQALQFIEAHRSEPFFLYLPHSAVHFPLYPGEAFRGKSNNGLMGDWIEEVDWSVGQVLDKLRSLDLAKQTLVIFTSDNGGSLRHGADNGPLRGGKGSTFEGGVRVCTVCWWPGKITAGTESDAISGMMDVLPTFASLSGGEVPSDRKIDGFDLSPVLFDRPASDFDERTFYYYRGLKLEAVRHGDWKYRLGSGELYNLKEDRGETMDVADRHPQVIEKMKQRIAAVDKDLGIDDVGPGCRPLGRVSDAQPLIGHDGEVRQGFAP